MKATISLTYRDGSEVCFTYESEESESLALSTLMMVCRGTLMASEGIEITAYNEEGFDISYSKNNRKTSVSHKKPKKLLWYKESRNNSSGVVSHRK